VIIYSPHFAMGFPGLRYLHPFDSYRARRAYQDLRAAFPEPGIWAAPSGPVSDSALHLVHTTEYLQSLRRSYVIAMAIEVPPFALTPRQFLNWCLVTPMRWATEGTLLTARQALEHGLAFSLSGGFHHAKPARGEGFCLFNDIAYAIRTLQREGRVAKTVYVDLDAHQGNGVTAMFREDPSVKMFDVYNGEIYPQDEPELRERLDASHPLEMGTETEPYLALLQRELPPFLDQHRDADLLIYNAGNDIVAGDRLGGLLVSEAGVLARDLLVIREARQRGLPVAFLPSGGYTTQSYKMISQTVQTALRN
jgi:histone deacetylase 11